MEDESRAESCDWVDFTKPKDKLFGGIKCMGQMQKDTLQKQTEKAMQS